MAPHDCYGGCYRAFTSLAKKGHFRVRFVDFTNESERELALAENAGRTLSHEQLLERVWGAEYVDEPGYVKRYIWYLRQKIDDPFETRHITTVRNVGYRLVPDT